jgi:hypothetical protein
MPVYTTKLQNLKIGKGELTLYNDSLVESLIFLDRSDSRIIMNDKKPFWNPILASSFNNMAADDTIEFSIPFTTDPHIITVYVVPSPVQPAPLGMIEVRVNDLTSTPVILIEGMPWVQQLPEHYIEKLYVKCLSNCKVVLDAEVSTPKIV